MRYRRKPVDEIVDAIRIDGTMEQLESCPWVQDAIRRGDVRLMGGGMGGPLQIVLPEIRTEDGVWKLVRPGWWVVLFPSGRIKATGQEEFGETYEAEQ